MNGLKDWRMTDEQRVSVWGMMNWRMTDEQMVSVGLSAFFPLYNEWSEGLEVAGQIDGECELVCLSPPIECMARDVPSF